MLGGRSNVDGVVALHNRDAVIDLNDVPLAVTEELKCITTVDTNVLRQKAIADHFGVVH